MRANFNCGFFAVGKREGRGYCVTANFNGSSNINTYLFNQRTVAIKTQATALNALSFLYSHIILRPLSQNLNFNKARVAQKLPVVLTRVEVQQLLALIEPKYKLLAQLMYGSGLRLMEAIRLRVQDIDFD